MRVRRRGLERPTCHDALPGGRLRVAATHVVGFGSTERQSVKRRAGETQESCHCIDCLSSTWAGSHGGVEGEVMLGMLGRMELRDAEPPSHRRRLREGQASMVLARSWLLMNAPPLI